MRLLLHIAALLVGAAVAVGSVAVHRIDVVGVPLGLLLALVVSFGVLWAVWQLHEVRRLPTAYAVGWLLPFGFLVAGRPEGDFVVASDGIGYTLMLGAIAVLVLGIAGLGRAPRPGRGQPGRLDRSP